MMADSLRPGGMGTAGDQPDRMPADFAGSMAMAIEDALNEILQQDNIQGFAQNTNASDARDRRRLLVAIAQGVVRHLAHHAGAFQVSFVDGSGNRQSSFVDGNGNLLRASVTIDTDPQALPAC